MEKQKLQQSSFLEFNKTKFIFYVGTPIN